MNSIKRRLSDLRFTNAFTRELTRDPLTQGDPLVRPSSRNPASIVPRQVHGAHFSFVQPEHLPDPHLISVSHSTAALLDIDNDDLDSTLAHSPAERDAFVAVVSGNEVPATTNPWAMCYGGHQFGSWASQLGDGRAICIGEATNAAGQPWEMQLKGAGMTPYSRFADGYAVLRSSIREFLCSEAMYHLGVPTTRALSLVGSSRLVSREKEETGAVVCRLAPTWVRFGSFEIFLSRNDVPGMRKLADWTIQHHFSHVLVEAPEEERYGRWLQEVVRKTAVMIAHWQAVGFCHGVMNTDNMSILGLTLDYGPFQFLDRYDPEYICNHSDHSGRYSFDSQASVGFWNLTKLASTLSPLIVEELGGDKEKAETRLREILQEYPKAFYRQYRVLMSEKLGLTMLRDDDLDTLVTPLMKVLGEQQPDYTHFFRSLSTDFRLAENQAASDSQDAAGKDACRIPGPSSPPLKDALKDWYPLYRSRLLADLSASALAPSTTPADVSRTSSSSSASSSSSPSGSTPDAADLAAADKDRTSRMTSVNPKYILRNHLAQRVIEEAEKGRYEAVNEFLEVLQTPYEEGTKTQQEKWAGPVPSWAVDMKCSCSS
ncbi:hypothetical protein HKX48_005315 [Thoreauomyces humboldtii]|nr:hypothetical protein HKX48_005315 [Thoreauomyces humboldtii]